LVTEQSFGGHENCRAVEFARWTRLMLHHEREYLSRVMAMSGAFTANEEKELIIHDLMDIDFFLSQLDVEVKVK
jgi:hypothetical protein